MYVRKNVYLTNDGLIKRLLWLLHLCAKWSIAIGVKKSYDCETRIFLYKFERQVLHIGVHLTLQTYIKRHVGFLNGKEYNSYTIIRKGHIIDLYLVTNEHCQNSFLSTISDWSCDICRYDVDFFI